jgi:hypothetical protein
MDLSLIIALLIVILLICCLYPKKENFADNYSILVPYIINTSPSFDYPNQYGDITNPYAKEKTDSQNQLFNQTHALFL